MKNVFSLLLLLFVSAHLSAQNEFLNKNNSLAPVGGIKMGTPSTSPSVYTPNVFNKDKATSSSKTTIPDKPVDMKTEQFLNSGDQYKKDLNKKLAREEIGLSADRLAFRKDSDLGHFKTMSKSVTISYRDYGEVDGDIVRIFLNGEVVKELVGLEYDYKSVKVTLRKGSNQIAFEALNTGMDFPNTAQFRVTDEQGNIITSNMWGLDAGFKAFINVESN